MTAPPRPGPASLAACAEKIEHDNMQLFHGAVRGTRHEAHFQTSILVSEATTIGSFL